MSRHLRHIWTVLGTVILLLAGCNQGACHGSPSGKGGFRLSLRAYDPALDIETLVREAYNRRTDLYEVRLLQGNIKSEP
jgi:hypothetical protein